MKKIIIILAFIIALIIGYNSREVEDFSAPEIPPTLGPVEDDVAPSLPEKKPLENETPDSPEDDEVSLQKLFEKNPKEVTDYQIELYARLVKHEIESNEMNQDEIRELAFRINELQSEELKYDIFEYLHESGLLNESDIEAILSQQAN